MKARARSRNTGKKYPLHRGQALRVQVVKKANTGNQVKRPTVTISSSGTRGRMTAAIGSHARIDTKAKSRRRRMVRRPCTILSDSGAIAWQVDANNGGPCFKPRTAKTEP